MKDTRLHVQFVSFNISFRAFLNIYLSTSFKSCVFISFEQVWTINAMYILCKYVNNFDAHRNFVFVHATDEYESGCSNEIIHNCAHEQNLPDPGTTTICHSALDLSRI